MTAQEPSDPIEAAASHMRIHGYDSWLCLRSDMRAAIAAYLRAEAARYQTAAKQETKQGWPDVARACSERAAHYRMKADRLVAAEVERPPGGWKGA